MIPPIDYMTFEFRRPERAAVADPNALYFVRLIYNKSNSGQLPDWIEQRRSRAATRRASRLRLRSRTDRARDGS